jgi:hypothetical protein
MHSTDRFLDSIVIGAFSRDVKEFANLSSGDLGFNNAAAISASADA